MKTGFNKERWKTLLPETYEWAATVKLDMVSDLISGATHVVLTGETKNDGDADNITLNALSVPDTLQKKIIASCASAGWKGSGTFLTVVEGTPFLVVTPPKIKTTKTQKSRAVGLQVAKAIKALKAGHLVICKGDGICSQGLIDGMANGLYNTVGFKAPKKDPAKSSLPSRISLWGGKIDAESEKSLRTMIRATHLTRFIQDAPGNWLDAPRFAEVAEDIAKDYGIKVTIHDKASLTTLGMGSFLSVNAGSVIEPRMIVLEIDGKDNGKCVSLIGKGLTFDSGGISLKPGPSMEEMKYDMSGGAAVLGAAMYLSQVKPPVKTICIIGATDNMPGGSATKPGDIVVSMSGKTIEVQNTDAEGRLVLCDLLHYANVTYKPEMMIDIATLTGAVLMALGTVGAALMSNDEALAGHVLKSANEGGEPFWQLPLWSEFESETKGTVADLNNIAKPSVKAGTIMGAMFLKEFVGTTKWAHLDIAGTGWNCKATGFPSSGGCAFGLRTMVESVLRYNQ